MCNSRYHSYDCTCGFGGVGHLGRRAYGNSGPGLAADRGLLFDISKIEKFRYSLDTFTNPNAVCPVCGAGVFYYQNDLGSKVYFDELWPPWQKHPCTDNSLQRGQFNSSTTRTPLVTKVDTLQEDGQNHARVPPTATSIIPKWQRNGWQVLQILRTTEVDRNVLQLDCKILSDKSEIRLYGPRKLESQHLVLSDFLFRDSKNISFLKSIDERKFEIAILTSYLKEINVLVASSLADFRPLLQTAEIGNRDDELGAIGMALQAARTKSKRRK